MSSITSTGLGSGVDINSLVDSLVEAEKAPQQERIDLRKTTAEATISAVGALKSALSEFQSKLADLNELKDFETTTASTSDSSVFSASADYTAISGTYAVEVEQLATAHKAMSTAFGDEELVGKGTLSLGVNGESFSVEVGVNDTIADVRNAINSAADNTGVRATIIKSDAGQRLVLTSAETGADNRISITVSDIDTENTDDQGLSRLHFDPDDPAGSQMSQTQEPLDARVYIDGELLTSGSNVIENAITGVTLALDKAEDDVTHTLSLYQDTAKLEEKITDVVEGYNKLLGTLSELQNGSVDEEGNELDALLPNDAMLRSLTTQVRRIFSSQISTNGNYNSLASLGVSTNRDGTLSLESSTLRGALDKGLEQVTAIFGSEGTGVANRLYDLVGEYISFEGVLDSRTKTANTQLERLVEDQNALDTRIEKYQARLFAQFNYMDSIVGTLTSTGDYLDQQLSLLPYGGGNKDN